MMNHNDQIMMQFIFYQLKNHKFINLLELNLKLLILHKFLILLTYDIYLYLQLIFFNFM